jgi:hypothetical protein
LIYLFELGRVSARLKRWERVSIKRLGNVLPNRSDKRHSSSESAVESGTEPPAVIVVDGDGGDDPDAEAAAFVRFCYRRRAVQWPELYDEMCAVAARGDYRGMDYEQLQGLGIGFALAALPGLAALSARVIAEERGPQPAVAVAVA